MRSVALTPEVTVRLLIVAICGGAVALAACFTPVPPGDAPLRLAGAPLPELCLMKANTTLRCPGCGLTRSWVSAAHLDLGGSLGHHRLGWLVLLYALLQAARHLTWLLASRKRHSIEAAGRWLDRALIPLGILLLVAWVPTLLEDLERLGWLGRPA